MPLHDKPPLRPLWSQIWVNTASWLIVCSVLGVGYIAYTVPRMLDTVLANQESYQADVIDIKARLLDVENRTMRLEVRP
jgi:hypothetical protein